MSLSKTITYPPEKSFLIAANKFHVTNKDRRGYNTIYVFRRSQSYFFELVVSHSITNQSILLLHTNDYLVSSEPIVFYLRRIQKKYFSLIRDIF
jgi:hypothetical protein